MPTLHEFITTVKKADMLLRPPSNLRIYKLVRFILGSQGIYNTNMEITIEDAEGIKTVHWTPAQIDQYIDHVLESFYEIKL